MLFSSPGWSPGRAIVLPPGVGVGVGVGIGGGGGISKKFNVKVFLCDVQGAVRPAILSLSQVLWSPVIKCPCDVFLILPEGAFNGIVPLSLMETFGMRVGVSE